MSQTLVRPHTQTQYPPSAIARKLRLLDDASYLQAVRLGVYDVDGRIPGFCDFDRMRRSEIAEQMGVSFNSTYSVLPDDGLKKLYREYVAGRFDRGGIIPQRIWRLMDKTVKKAVADTLRGRRNHIQPDSPSVHNAKQLPTNRLGDPVLGHPRKKRSPYPSFL